MFKIIASIVLSITLIVLARTAVVSLQTESLPVLAEGGEQQEKNENLKRIPAKPVKFYPDIPVPLPDLNEKYLFNEERFLQGEKEEEEPELKEASGNELNVDIETVFYVGSIIIGDLRKGLISYTENKTPTAVTSKSRSKTPTRLNTKKYAQLVAGDSLSGYKVETVDPDRIVFSKGTEKIEKLLNDPKKERIKPPTPPRKTVTRKNTAAPAQKTTRRVVQSSRSVKPAPNVVNRRLPVKKEKIQIPGVPPQNQ